MFEPVSESRDPSFARGVEKRVVRRSKLFFPRSIWRPGHGGTDFRSPHGVTSYDGAAPLADSTKKKAVLRENSVTPWLRVQGFVMLLRKMRARSSIYSRVARLAFRVSRLAFRVSRPLN